jgi:hypothetical protein
MTSKITNRNLSPRATALVLATACTVIGAVELQALKAHELARNPPQKIDTAYCLKCHSDPKTIKMMRMKEGGSSVLFNADGTFKDSKFAALNPDYQHKGGTSTAVKY